jgi:hypothetical protein
MFINYASGNIKQSDNIDIVTIKQYHPEILTAFSVLCNNMGIPSDWIFKNECPDIIVSGYRDHAYDPAVKNSPHNFAIALDVQVSQFNAHNPINQARVLESQIAWISKATEGNLFNRAGFYPQQNTIHLDIADDDWMSKYNGTKFWVKWRGIYTGFNVLNEAIAYSKYKINVG